MVVDKSKEEVHEERRCKVRILARGQAPGQAKSKPRDRVVGACLAQARRPWSAEPANAACESIRRME